MDTIHATNPFHLIRCLERFGHTFGSCHIRGDVFHSLNTGVVDLGKVLIQFSRKQEVCKENRPMLFEISFSHPAILADVVFRRVRLKR